MKYIEFRERIKSDLESCPEGLTWIELRMRNALPYQRACPDWTRHLEKDIGLKRVKRRGYGNALVWMLE